MDGAPSPAFLVSAQRGVQERGEGALQIVGPRIVQPAERDEQLVEQFLYGYCFASRVSRPR